MRAQQARHGAFWRWPQPQLALSSHHHSMAVALSACLCVVASSPQLGGAAFGCLCVALFGGPPPKVCAAVDATHANGLWLALDPAPQPGNLPLGENPGEDAACGRVLAGTCSNAAGVASGTCFGCCWCNLCWHLCDRSCEQAKDQPGLGSAQATVKAKPSLQASPNCAPATVDQGSGSGSAAHSCG